MLENEHDLIRKAKDGDRAAFEALYEHYVEAIYRFVVLKVSSQRDAEDLTHEVFLASWKNLGSYRYKGVPFSSWLYRIARNKVIDHYRTRRDHADIEQVNPNIFVSSDSPERDADILLDVERVKQSLDRLSSDQKDVTIMRFVEELSHREIAKALGKSEGAVRLIQHRALKNLREFLKESDNDHDA